MDPDNTPSATGQFEFHLEHPSLPEHTPSERALFELDPEVAKARRGERKVSSFQLPPDRPMSFFHKAKLLFFAAALGSLYHWLPFHHAHVPGFDVRKATIEPSSEPRKVPVGNVPAPPAENWETYSIAPKAAVPQITTPGTDVPKRNYPYDVSLIISPGDWPYVRSALIVAFGFGAHPQLVRWANPQNGHDGSVTSTGIKENGDGCLQFRVTRKIRDAKDKAPRLAHVEFCRDGTMK